MFPEFFLQQVGEPVVFETVSSAWVFATTTACYLTKKRKDQELSKSLVESEDGLNYLVEYFGLDGEYDGEKIKNMFNYYLKKKLK